VNAVDLSSLSMRPSSRAPIVLPREPAIMQLAGSPIASFGQG
jgi:hypothetical protein